MDAQFLYELIQQDETKFGSMVLKIMGARYMGTSPGGQTYIGFAMQAIKTMLQAIDQNPKLGSNRKEAGALGGCMTRTNLLFHRSSLHMAMGNQNKALNDLTKALKIDPKYLAARDARASLWAGLQIRDNATLYAEYKQISAESHPDNRALDVSYGWMALMTMKDSKIGTVQEAKHFYGMCLRAEMRRTELYGPRATGAVPPILGLYKEQFALYVNRPDVRKFRLRDDCDAAMLSGRMSDLRIPATLHAARCTT